MELVPLPGAISHHNRMETDVLEVLQTQGVGHLGVQAAGAKFSVTLLNRAIVHDIVGRDARTARLAADHAAALLTLVTHVISNELVSAQPTAVSWLVGSMPSSRRIWANSFGSARLVERRLMRVDTSQPLPAFFTKQGSPGCAYRPELSSVSSSQHNGCDRAGHERHSSIASAPGHGTTVSGRTTKDGRKPSV
jgi:hypothetical protein